MSFIENIIMDKDNIRKLRLFYKNPPSNIDKESLENQIRFVEKIKNNLLVERNIDDYKDKGLTESDYEDVAILVVLNAINLPGIEDYDDPDFCEICGRCCIITDEIMLKEKDYERLKESIKNIDDYIRPHPEYNNRYLLDSQPCVFHDPESRKCTIHDIRPTVCRTHPISFRKINGKQIKMTYILPDCPYSVKLVSKVALDIFDRCFSSK